MNRVASLFLILFALSSHGAVIVTGGRGGGGGSATNAVNTVKTNGVTISSGARTLNFTNAAGTNVTASLSGTEVTIGIPTQGVSSGGGTVSGVSNVHPESFSISNGTLYSRSPEGIRGLQYWDNFQRPLWASGVVPDSPSGHSYRLIGSPASATNFFDVRDGFWASGSNGALYLSISNNNAGIIGSAKRMNQFGGTFRYDFSTNGTIDGVERNLGFVLSSNADFVTKSPLYLHVGINAAGIQVQRELSSTNFINETFGGAYLVYRTNYNFTLTILSNTITVEVGGYRFQKSDPAIGLYANFTVATWESTGTPTNQIFGRWGQPWAGYAQADEAALFAGPFKFGTNFWLDAVEFSDGTRQGSAGLTNGQTGTVTLNGDVIFGGSVGTVIASINTSNYFGGRMQLAGGSPGTGKIFTSLDAQGNAAWSDTISLAGTNAGSVSLAGTNGNGSVTWQVHKDVATKRTNITGEVHASAAAVVEFDMTKGDLLLITNRISANLSQVLTNYNGASMSGLVLGHASTPYTVTTIPHTGILVANLNDFGAALATSVSETLTNGNALEWSARITRLNGTNVLGYVSRQFKF